MKILGRDRKAKTAKLMVETADDLWFLHTLLDAGDRCTGESDYKFKIGGATEKTAVIRKRVWVTITVEKSDFSAKTGQLRISGVVVDGTEEVPRGSHHALEVEVGTTITVEKEKWLDIHEQKLAESTETKLRTLLVLFDRESAIFAQLTPTGHEILLELKGNVSKKGADDQKTQNFYQEIAQHLVEFDRRLGLQHAIAASPGFWSEYLRKELPPEMHKKMIFTTVSVADESAIGELLKRPELNQALAGERAARDAKIVETILAALGRDKLIYGMADLQQIVNEGNLSELTVTESAITKAREHNTFNELESLMQSASGIGAKVHLLSSEDAMRKVDALGGVVGIRRW